MVEDLPSKKRKRSPAFIVVPLLMLILATTFVLLNSNLALSKTTVTYTEIEGSYLNRMTIVAPYGAYVQTFSVVPGFSNEKPYYIGGSMGPGSSTSLFDKIEVRSNSIPGTGRIADIDYGTPVKITNRMPMSAVAQMPKDKAMLANCGKYIWVTKKPKTEADFKAFADELNRAYQESKKTK